MNTFVRTSYQGSEFGVPTDLEAAGTSLENPYAYDSAARELDDTGVNRWESGMRRGAIAMAGLMLARVAAAQETPPAGYLPATPIAASKIILVGDSTSAVVGRKEECSVDTS